MNRTRSRSGGVVYGLFLCAVGVGVSFTLSICIGGLMALLGYARSP